MVRTGIRWNDLPTSAFGVSGATCWRRLKEWHEAGVWQRLHETLLGELRTSDLLDLAHTVVDSSYLRALKGGLTGPSRSTGPPGQQAPSDHRRRRHPSGSDPDRRPRQRRHPAAAATPGRDPADPRPTRTAETTPPQGRRRPRLRPRQYRQLLRERGITPVIARRGTAHGSGLDRLRWVVERTFAWLHAFRRLRTRYERRAHTHQATISLACSIICLRNLLTLR